MRRALLAIVLLWAAPAVAAEDACAFKWPVGREKAALAAPDLPALGSGGPLPAGGAVRLTLAPQDGVAYSRKPVHTPKHSPAFGGEYALAAPPATTLQVTLSDDAWVDVVQNGKVLRSTAFSGKTGCPGLRKSVRFTLAPGPALIAISDSPAAAISMAVLPAE